MENLKTGVLYAGLSDDEYNAAPGVRATALKRILECPARLRHETLHPSAPTPAMRLGSLVHQAILEPAKFASSVPEAGKQTKDMELAAAMRDAAWAVPEVRQLLENSQKEVAVFWDEEFEGQSVRCKAKLDMLARHPGGKLVAVDLKTTTDASHQAFCREVDKLRYDLQAHHYLSAGAKTGLFDANEFVFVAIEKRPPHLCAVYRIHPAVLGLGLLWWEEAMRLHADCAASQQWPGLPQNLTLVPPAWAKAPGDWQDYLDGKMGTC